MYQEKFSLVPPLPANIALTTLSGGISIKGAIAVNVRLNSMESITRLNKVLAYSLPGFDALLGRDWLDVLIPHWRSIPVYAVTATVIDRLKEQFVPIFNPLNDDPIRVEPVSLITKSEFKPISRNAYSTCTVHRMQS